MAKVVAENKKAFFDYEILERYEAGIVLTGDEVKSVRSGRLSLVASFATIHNNELFLLNATIAVYDNAYKKDESQQTRTRKLLLNRSELRRLIGKVAEKGLTLVPLRAYFSKSRRLKIELGLARHKKAHQKKELLRERDIQRETRRALKGTYDY